MVCGRRMSERASESARVAERWTAGGIARSELAKRVWELPAWCNTGTDCRLLKYCIVASVVSDRAE